MHVVVTGATGLVGSALVPLLRRDGHAVTRFSRTASGEDVARWDPAAGVLDTGVLAAADAVVHLAGRSIGAPRWTGRVKREILQSRTSGTRLLAETMAGLPKGPRVLVSSSGVHYYGDRGDEELTEASPPGDSFLAEVVTEWEAASSPADEAGIRVVRLRFGIVLSPEGGALRRMLLPFRLGLGGRFGSGRQWMSWISLDDVVGAIGHALVTDRLTGAANAVAPSPVTNAAFTKALGRVLHRPTVLAVPAPVLRVALGEFAGELLSSVRVLQRRLAQSGYEFRHPELEPALGDLLR